MVEVHGYVLRRAEPRPERLAFGFIAPGATRKLPLVIDGPYGDKILIEKIDGGPSGMVKGRLLSDPAMLSSASLEISMSPSAHLRIGDRIVEDLMIAGRAGVNPFLINVPVSAILEGSGDSPPSQAIRVPD